MSQTQRRAEQRAASMTWHLEQTAIACHGERGEWAYSVYGWANKALFESKLPPVIIHWELTPYGKCFGDTRASETPVIRLHPAIWGSGELHAAELSEAWGGIPACRLYALDVLVHELAHVRVACVGGENYLTSTYHSSHDNRWWPAEIERLSPLLGLGTVIASQTKRARRDGRMARVPAKEGALPMAKLATWPYSVRAAGYYQGDGQDPTDPDVTL